MLQSHTVTPALMDLVKSLCSKSYIEQFNLVWWTNLALRYGHRHSTDIDLFTNSPFDTEMLFAQILQDYPGTQLHKKNDTMIFCFVNTIKVDFVYLPYQFLHPAEHLEWVRLASLEDIMSMKISAIANRWSKKDFWDIALCFNTTIPNYSIQKLINLYTARYKTNDITHILRSLIYFDDADIQPDPIAYIPITWTQIKKHITDAMYIYTTSLS
jgi:hypothetical protein